MKKRIKSFLAVLLAAVLIAIACGFFYTQYTVFELSPMILKAMVGKDISPEGFLLTKGKDTALFNAYTYARVNRDGNLILIMSEEEIIAYKNSNIDVRLGVFQRILGEERDIGVEPYMPEDDLVKTFLDGLDTCGLEISYDYTKIYESPDDNSL